MRRMIVLGVFCLLFSGCATWYQRSVAFQQAVGNGEFEQAEKLLKRDKKQSRKKNQILYYLNLGYVYFMLGNQEASNAAFETAERLTEEQRRNVLTEAAVLGLPALVVPWMQAADNHQFHNALAFAGENEGMIWTENDGHEALVSSLVRLNGIKGKNHDRAGDLRGRGGAICENLWSLLFPAV